MYLLIIHFTTLSYFESQKDQFFISPIFLANATT